MSAGTALQGLLVIDLSRVLAGPFCGQMLADMGADVIKIEPLTGDENRAWPPFAPDTSSCNFASVNRGKRSLTLDLKTAAGQDILRRLLAKADVLIHNFLPDTAARLGLDAGAWDRLNPRLVVCAVSGYGAEGPLANKPGYDLMMQAFAGTMSMTGYPDSPPVRTGISFIDMSTGLSAYGAIVTALLARERTGRGTTVRASLLETAISLLGYHAVAFLQAGILPKREGSGVYHLVPYQAFKCSDDYILAGATNNPAWQRFCAAVDMPELLEDERFVSNDTRAANRDALVPLLERRFLDKSAAEWVAILEANGVAVAPIQPLDKVLTHPQVLANSMVIHHGLVGTAFKLRDGGGIGETPAPTLGADNETILRNDLGLGDEAIAALRAQSAIL